MSFPGLLNLTCTLKEPTWTISTDSSGNIPTYGSGTTSVRCAIQSRDTNEQERSAREAGVTEFVVYFMPTQTVDVDYTISAIAGGAGYQDIWSGKVLGVVSLYADGSGRGVYKKVRARLVDGGPNP